MGIRGLETFFDGIYAREESGAVYEDETLSDLRLVVDGNQLAYFLSSLFAANQWCGNYDEYYAYLRNLIALLAPSIEVVIFDGCKELQAKARRRLEQRCELLSTAVSEEQEKTLQEYPALFNRLVLHEVLNEFNIKVRMCEGLADHIIALYANGYNDCDGRKFTVLSKASFFNVYNLEKGYLCVKHLQPYLVKSKADSTYDFMSSRVPVFHLKKLMSHFCLDSHLTWIYFCILCGNTDDVELGRNYKYFQQKGIDISPGDFTHLIAHLKLNEHHLQETNYEQIRVYYSRTALAKIDELIELFKMKNHEYKFLTPINGKLSEFDRLFATLRQTLSNFLPCMVEDYANAAESCAFEAADEPIRAVYASLRHRFHDAIMTRADKTLREYRRTRGPICRDGQLIELNMFDLNDEAALNELKAFRKCFEYLRETEKIATLDSCQDDFTLLIVSLIYWEKWLGTKLENRFKGCLKNSDFQEAIFRNLILIAAESKKLGVVSKYSNLVQVLSQDEETCMRLSKSYKNLLSTPKRTNLKLVHSLSEFQAIYYYLGALNEIKVFHLKMLSPSRFFNSNFLLKFLVDRATRSSDVNNNSNNGSGDEKESNLRLSHDDVECLRDLDALFATSETVKKCMRLLEEVYAPCKLDTSKIKFEEFLKTSTTPETKTVMTSREVNETWHRHDFGVRSQNRGQGQGQSNWMHNEDRFKSGFRRVKHEADTSDNWRASMMPRDENNNRQELSSPSKEEHQKGSSNRSNFKSDFKHFRQFGATSGLDWRQQLNKNKEKRDEEYEKHKPATSKALEDSTKDH